MSAPQDEDVDKKQAADILFVKQLNDRLIASENQNKLLKELLIYNLGLVQRQSEIISRKDKLNKVLREGYDSIKSTQNKKHHLNLPPPSPPPVNIFSPLHLPELLTGGKIIEPDQKKIEFLRELLAENNSNSLLIDDNNDQNVNVPSILEPTKPNQLKMFFENFEEVDGKSMLTEEAIKFEPPYIVSPINDNPMLKKIQKQKVKTVIERVDYEPKSVPKVKTELNNILEDYDYFGTKRKNRLIKTYTQTIKATTTCTLATTTRTVSNTQISGSDTSQLMDTTPLQHVKDEPRVQLPIPKLMLQKTKRGCIDSHPISNKDAAKAKNKRESHWRIHKSNPESSLVIPKSEPSMSDSVISNIMENEKNQDFSPSEFSRNIEDSKVPSTQKIAAEESNSQKRKKKHTSGTGCKGKRGKDGKRARAKRAKSSDTRKSKKEPAASIDKTPRSVKTTDSEYQIYAKHPDVDSEMKSNDLDRGTDKNPAVVEVPKWRVKTYSPIYNPEGTENLDDKVFEKRHHKYEVKERQQMRWHVRRIREQRRLEKLRQRYSNPGPTVAPARRVDTLRPRTQKDIQFIEITDTLPVTAFGEGLPDLPEEEFSLPWVRASDELKRSKRYNTRQD